MLPIKHVAEWFGVSWDTVKQIDKRSLERRLGPVDLSTVRVIAIDEFAIQRGHRYATVIVDPTTKRVLWVGRGVGGKMSVPSSNCSAPPAALGSRLSLWT